MDSCMPERLKSEAARIAQIWIDSNDPLETVVEKHASPEYKRYFKAKRERDRKLKEKGIIEN